MAVVITITCTYSSFVSCVRVTHYLCKLLKCMDLILSMHVIHYSLLGDFNLIKTSCTCSSEETFLYGLFNNFEKNVSLELTRDSRSNDCTEIDKTITLMQWVKLDLD